MTTEETTAREQLVEQILSASTLEEVAAARRRLHEWRRNHPDDLGILTAGEQLAMVEGALREMARRSA